jgi:hypothetical protein
MIPYSACGIRVLEPALTRLMHPIVLQAWYRDTKCTHCFPCPATASHRTTSPKLGDEARICNQRMSHSHQCAPHEALSCCLTCAHLAYPAIMSTLSRNSVSKEARFRARTGCDCASICWTCAVCGVEGGRGMDGDERASVRAPVVPPVKPAPAADPGGT